MAKDLTDAQWAFIKPLLPELPKRPDRRGRPWRDSREVLNGILWILRTGAQWSEMPSRYPPYQTCHRRFQQWRKSSVMDRLLEALARVALCTGSASPHETKFVTELIDQRFTEDKPERLIGDKAYDSDPLDAECTAKGVTMISPHKTNRKKPKSQDGRALRRYNRRWKVERLFAWLQNYRRLVTRFEYHVENFLAFLKARRFHDHGKEVFMRWLLSSCEKYFNSGGA